MESSEITKQTEAAISKIVASVSLEELDDIRVSSLGKSGFITEAMKTLGKLSPDERKQFGNFLNSLKNDIAAQIETKKLALEKIEIDKQLASEKIDLTLPPRPLYTGKIHPLTQVIDEVIAIFGEMGFSVAEGPNIEDDFHNFTALNIPASHPSRQMHDTFYLKNTEASQNMLLRTHTSPIQIRSMVNSKPPFRFIAPDRCYRCDWDMTHTPMFHQVEALLVDEKINMAHLKGCISQFLKEFFEIDHVPLRFRASYFPFTEPSAEVDIGCSWQGKELSIGEGKDWLEILGCGMVHPNVLRNAGIDPDKYQGFAFGIGLERIAMLKYGIGDLRTFFDSDLRWLNHYGFAPFDIPSLIGGLTR